MIIADIPTQSPSSTRGGYSRNGHWYMTFECDNYASRHYPEQFFTERQLRLHMLKALDSLEAESKMERPVIDVKRARKK